MPANKKEPYPPRASLAALSLLGAVLLIFLFIFKDIHSWDFFNYVLWRFTLIRQHLCAEWTMPYFTPGRCGGFLLAADAQGYIFSLYMLTSLLIPNVIWAVKLTTLLVSFILVTGIFHWLRYLGVKDPLSRLFAGFLTACSGYWFFHMGQEAQICAHGAAFVPWTMILIEKMLERPSKRDRRTQKAFLGLILLNFLIINSGYFWVLYFPMLVGFRLLVELFQPRGKRTGLVLVTGAVCSSVLLAVLLSWHRIGAVFEFQLSKYPRMGGAINHMQVIGDSAYLIKTLVRSFFDPDIIIQHQSNPYLGGHFEYTNFLGVVSLIALAWGCRQLGRAGKSKAFIALVLASIFQVALTRSTHVADALRLICPVYNQVTHYWRGSITILFLAAVIIALGYEAIISHRRALFTIIVFTLMALSLTELFLVYQAATKFRLVPPLSAITRCERPLPGVMTEHYAPCSLVHLFGYGCVERIPDQLSVDFKRPTTDMLDNNHYNMHDIRKLFGPKADGGFYLKNDWPLWPKADKTELEEFLNYRQIIPLPRRLIIMNTVSKLAWLVYLACGVAMLIKIRD